MIRVPLARCIAVVALLVLMVLTPMAPARAHDRTTSYSTWDIQGRTAKVSLRLTLLDASRFPWFGNRDAGTTLQRYITQHLTLNAGDSPCAVDAPPQRLESAPERLVYEWHVACAPTGGLSIHSDLLLQVAPSHLHFARATVDGTALAEHVFSDAQRVWTISASANGSGAPAVGASLLEYVVVGIEHILTGYDHLAFLLALLLVERSALDVAKVVTGFTVGHSITLAIAALGLVHPARAAVESSIALSIAMVAAEDLWLLARQPAALPWLMSAALAVFAVGAGSSHRVISAASIGGWALFAFCYFNLSRRVHYPLRLRWAIAFLFGLVHGFAFASVLVEAEIPAGRLAHALLGFNLGVEAGQLAVVAVTWPLATVIMRQLRVRHRALLVELTSAAMLALGIFWFITRAYG